MSSLTAAQFAHHSLRHAYATIRHEKGKDIGTISKLLGHANPTIMQNIYVHCRDEQIHQASLDVEVCRQMLQKVQNLESNL
jgi:site-specific recombinase XerD